MCAISQKQLKIQSGAAGTALLQKRGQMTAWVLLCSCDRLASHLSKRRNHNVPPTSGAVLSSSIALDKFVASEPANDGAQPVPNVRDVHGYLVTPIAVQKFRRL